MCFFGFLHSGEITVPSASHYDPSAYLTVKDVDVQINSRENPTVLKVLIKASKTDPFRKGVSIFLGRTDNSLCPVAAITAYLASRGPDSGPLFCFRKGSYLTCEAFVREKWETGKRRNGKSINLLERLVTEILTKSCMVANECNVGHCAHVYHSNCATYSLSMSEWISSCGKRRQRR